MSDSQDLELGQETGGPLPGEDFDRVFDAHFAEIHRYIARRLDTHAADDLAADTFLVAFRTRHRFDAARGAVRPWLYGIATNLVARHRREEVRRWKALSRTGGRDARTREDGHEDAVVASKRRAGSKGSVILYATVGTLGWTDGPPTPPRGCPMKAGAVCP